MIKMPPMNERTLSDNAVGYLNSRGISKDTAERYGIFSTFDNISHYTDGGKKEWYNDVEILVFPNSLNSWGTRTLRNDLPDDCKKRKNASRIDEYDLNSKKYQQCPFGCIQYYTDEKGAVRRGIYEWDYFFLCEGEFDALSFIEYNSWAMATGGVNISRLFELIKSRSFSLPPVIISGFDYDDAGRGAYVRLRELCDRNHYKGKVLNFWDYVSDAILTTVPPDGKLDVNDLLVKYPNDFQDALCNARNHMCSVLKYNNNYTPVTVTDINDGSGADDSWVIDGVAVNGTDEPKEKERLIVAPVEVVPVEVALSDNIPNSGTYLTDAEREWNEFNSMFGGRALFRKFKERQDNPLPVYETPFPDLNCRLNGGYRMGLHFVGGTSGLGKTAFMLFMATHFARNGHPVYYYTYEIENNAILGRIMSSASYDLHSTNALTMTNIQERKRWNSASGQLDNLTVPQLKTLSEVEDYFCNSLSDNFWIIDGASSDEPPTADSISRQVMLGRRMTGKPPIVFIDYLQLMSYAPNMSNQQGVEYNVRTLKRLSTRSEGVVFAVTSMNRESYGRTPDERSGKETGLIEYMADSLFFLSPYNIATVPQLELPEFIQNFKRCPNGKRQVDLHMVKLRNGESGYILTFDNVPKYGHFACTGENKTIQKLPQTTNGNSNDGRRYTSTKKRNGAVSDEKVTSIMEQVKQQVGNTVTSDDDTIPF